MNLDTHDPSIKPRAITHIKVLVDGREREFTGREAWALNELVMEGGRGCTPIDRVGPRWSEYVRRLRSKGIEIETVRERHGGAYAGNHGRYVLRSPVEVVSTGGAA